MLSQLESMQFFWEKTKERKKIKIKCERERSSHVMQRETVIKGPPTSPRKGHKGERGVGGGERNGNSR